MYVALCQSVFFQELFEMFSVFDYNTLVSSRALETIWNKDSLETEELLMGEKYIHVHGHASQHVHCTLSKYMYTEYALLASQHVHCTLWMRCIYVYMDMHHNMYIHCTFH